MANSNLTVNNLTKEQVAGLMLAIQTGDGEGAIPTDCHLYEHRAVILEALRHRRGELVNANLARQAKSAGCSEMQKVCDQRARYNRGWQVMNKTDNWLNLYLTWLSEQGVAQQLAEAS